MPSDFRHLSHMIGKLLTRGAFSLLLPLFSLACDRPAQTTAPASTSAATAEAPAATVASAAPAPSSAPAVSEHALTPAAFAGLVDKLSEPDAEFFSDNFISNETSYLQVARQLASHEKGGAYVGVGPEQNFTYIALMRPDVAYIVDIRRDNLILQLLYKAAFEKASSRAHFLALLTGRDYPGDQGLADGAPLEAVLAHVEKNQATKESYERVHQTLLTHITDAVGVELDDKDRRTLERSHRAFFKDGLDIRFSLKQESFRKYPSLRELALQEDPEGNRTGFLAADESFRFVQRMQRENRVIPLVGDFAGDRAMPALAAHMKAKRQTLRGFYVSNVEQYLMVDGKWWKWQRNVADFPIDEHSLFIRCYLDQGKPHPAQMAGHRTATTLHRITDFNERKAPYASMLALASYKSLTTAAPHVAVPR